MNNLKQIFDKLQATNGRIEKENILKENIDNEIFKFTLHYLLNPFITTGLSVKKINKSVEIISYAPLVRTENEIVYFETLLDYIKENNTGRDIDIAICQLFFRNFENEMQDFIKAILTKSLKIGLDAKTVNKIYGDNFIPTFNVMLGTAIEKCKINNGDWFSISHKLNGCFAPNTQIIMSDGTKKRIKDINIGDYVLSFDENTQEISTQKVLNVYDNGNKAKNEWLQIDCNLEKGRCYREFMVVTKSHKIFTPIGWINAGNLKLGDEIYIRDYELSDTQISVLTGIGLGDGSLYKDNKDKPIVRFSYPKKIKDFNKFLHNTCDLFDIYKGTYSTRTSGYGTKIERCTLKSMFNIPSFLVNNENILRSGYTFTDEMVRQITPLALAIYYIDDGSKLPCLEDGNIYATNKQPRTVLATHRHGKEEVERFSKFLYERYLIENRIKQYNESYGNSGYQIEITANGTIALFNLIAKYIPPEIRDIKLSKRWHNVPYEDWTKDYGQYKLIKCQIENITNGEDLKSFVNNTIHAYDLEVENTHTYFANNIAVHNCRSLYYKGDLYTRSGKKYTGVEHIINDLKRVLINSNIVVDGELVRKNTDNKSDSENFQIGVGIANSKAETKEELKLVIFDIITTNDFENGKSKLTYRERKPEIEALREIIQQLNLKNISVVEIFYEGIDQSQIWKWLDYAEQNDIEGIMLNLDTPYECKRTKNLIKVKLFKECDLLCTGIENGTGKNKNTLGNIICDYKGFQCRVGSGFTDEQRNYYYNNPDEIIGKIVTVKYKEETKNKNGGISLQFPILQTVRFDKTEPNY